MSPCALWGTGDVGGPQGWASQEQKVPHPPLVHPLSTQCQPHGHSWWDTGVPGAAPLQEQGQTRGLAQGRMFCVTPRGCTLRKQHLQGAPGAYPKRAVGLLLERCAAGPCSLAHTGAYPASVVGWPQPPLQQKHRIALSNARFSSPGELLWLSSVPQRERSPTCAALGQLCPPSRDLPYLLCKDEGYSASSPLCGTSWAQSKFNATNLILSCN